MRDPGRELDPSPDGAHCTNEIAIFLRRNCALDRSAACPEMEVQCGSESGLPV